VQTRVAVIGAGSWGTTVASMLAGRAPTVLWAREPEVADALGAGRGNPVFLPGVPLDPALRATTDLGEAVDGAGLVVVAVPTQHLRSVATELAARWGAVAAGAVVISLAKGIEQHTLRRPSEVLTELLGGQDPARIGVLSGPNLAREIAAGQPAATVVAAADPDAARFAQRLLMHSRFRVYTSHDVVGCEIGGAVKNVIAIGAGIADGLGYGWNARAALITRGLAELARLGVALGGEPLTFLGLAGNGDLIATCSSDESRNRRVGVALGRGRPLAEILGEMRMVAEGVASAPAVLELAATCGVEMPISAEVAAVLRGERSPAGAVEALMGREPTTELHDLPPVGRPRP
jgi:glycerol-3-phosphate dehydrogenase (NAD(P)+)